MRVPENLRKAAVILIGLVLAWQIVSINVSDHYVALAEKGNENAIDSALFWDGDHPRALALRGFRSLAAGDDAAAEADFSRAVQGNPSDARPLLALADIRRRRGEESVADEMARLADRLMPVEPSVQRRLAQYWMDRTRLDLALPHLSKALSGGASKEALFPFLLQVSSYPDSREALAPLLAEPPAWWEAFFRYAANNAEDSAVLRELVAIRKASGPLSENERRVYINRLRKDGLVAEAYLNWVNGLSQEDLGALGLLYNGSFERDISNFGFDWHARPPKNSGIRISTATTYGIDGARALHVTFRGKRVRFSQLWQDLFLQAGRYRLEGNVRTDSLKVRRGLAWIIRCSAGAAGQLGRSEPIKGTSDWRHFEVEFEVPADCAGQRLQLHTIGARDVDHEAEGGIWFDAMRITRLAGPSAEQPAAEDGAAEDVSQQPPTVPGMPFLLDKNP